MVLNHFNTNKTQTKQHELTKSQIEGRGKMKKEKEKRKTKDSTFLKGPFGWKSGKVGGWKIVGGWKCGKMENI